MVYLKVLVVLYDIKQRRARIVRKSLALIEKSSRKVYKKCHQRNEANERTVLYQFLFRDSVPTYLGLGQAVFALNDIRIILSSQMYIREQPTSDNNRSPYSLGQCLMNDFYL